MLFRSGFVMRDVIGATRCPSGDGGCLARMFFVQAFPYDAAGLAGTGNTGYRGSLGSLAVAIVEGWDHWKTFGDGSRLVNSMSLGWDRSFSGIPSEPEEITDDWETSTDDPNASIEETWGDGEPWDLPQVASPLDLIASPSSSVPAPVQAVYAALTLAACDGVLSLAAAGNDRGLRCEQQGPLGPAAWESHTVSIAECQALGLDTSGFEEGPLVYAVGGLDAKDRPNGQPDRLFRNRGRGSFVEVTASGWDHHRSLTESLTSSCRAVDKPIAGLLADLSQRDLLNETLVLWGGEFGRSPYAQGDGRDHNHWGFTTWLAGGGVKGGMAHGATDNFGFRAVLPDVLHAAEGEAPEPLLSPASWPRSTGRSWVDGPSCPASSRA